MSGEREVHDDSVSLALMLWRSSGHVVVQYFSDWGYHIPFCLYLRDPLCLVTNLELLNIHDEEEREYLFECLPYFHSVRNCKLQIDFIDNVNDEPERNEDEHNAHNALVGGRVKYRLLRALCKNQRIIGTFEVATDCELHELMTVYDLHFITDVISRNNGVETDEMKLQKYLLYLCAGHLPDFYAHLRGNPPILDQL